MGTMVGSIIGVGVFGLPYAFSQSGFLLGLCVMLFVGLMMILLQLMYAELAVQTPGKKQLIGYVRAYLGEGWSWLAVVALAASFWGAMLAYMILGGEFLHALFSPVVGGTYALYAVLLALAAAALMYKGLRFVARLDLVIVVALLFLFAFIFLAALPHVTLEHFAHVDVRKLFVPYGVALFSLSGIGAIPEIKELLGPRPYLLPQVVITGLLVILGLYATFAFAVVGVTGTATTPAAFEGLVPTLGPAFLLLGSVIGSLTILSIFTVLGVIMMDTLSFDFGMPRLPAWVLVAGVPIVLYIAGLREFIDTVGFVGTVFGGFLGIVIVLTYEGLRKRPSRTLGKCVKVPRFISWIIMAIFTAGMVWQVVEAVA